MHTYNWMLLLALVSGASSRVSNTVKRSGDDTYTIGVGTSVLDVFSYHGIETTNVTVTTPSNSSAIRKRDECPVPATIWNQFGPFLTEHAWVFYATAGVAAVVFSGFAFAVMIVGYRQCYRQYRHLKADIKSKTVKREQPFIYVEVPGYLDEDGVAQNIDNINAMYSVNLNTGEIYPSVYRGQVTLPTSNSTGLEKRSGCATYTADMSLAGPLCNQPSDQDLDHFFYDMMAGTWRNSGESCFTQSVCCDQGCTGIYLQLSSYTGYNKDLWGGCCGVDRGGSWTDYTNGNANC